MGTKKKSWITIQSLISQITVFTVFNFCVYTVFKSSLLYYFFQDDWFTFTISRASNINEFLSFFIPRTDVVYYRPIGMQIYFYLMNNLFGVNHIAFRWSSIIINSFNAYLVYRLLLKFKFKQSLAIFAGLFFAGSVAVYIPFFWSATFPFILGPLFFIASFLSFVYESKLGKILALIFFILGMLTLENTIILPVLFILWGFIYKKKILYKDVFPYFALVMFYVILRTIIFPPPLIQSYEISLNIASTLRNYLLWLFNWPEEIGRQMIGPFSISTIFIKNFRNYVYRWTLSSAIVIVMTIVIPFIAGIFKKKKISINKNSMFGLLWIIISLTLLILFSNHMFPYYLPVTLFGFIIFITGLLSQFVESFHIKSFVLLFYLSVIIAFWYWAGFNVIKFNQKVHWATKRARMAKYVIDRLTPQIKPYGNYKINLRNKLFYLALNNQDGLHVVFGENVETLYGDLGLNPELPPSGYTIISPLNEYLTVESF